MNFIIIRNETGKTLQHRVNGKIVPKQEFEDRYNFYMLIGSYNSSYTYRSRRGNFIHSFCISL